MVYFGQVGSDSKVLPTQISLCADFEPSLQLDRRLHSSSPNLVGGKKEVQQIRLGVLNAPGSLQVLGKCAQGS